MHKAQSLGEYSICISVVIVAITAMQLYLRAGLQTRYAELTDVTVAQVSDVIHYEPYYLEQQEEVYQSQVIKEKFKPAGDLRMEIEEGIRSVPLRKSVEGINPYK